MSNIKGKSPFYPGQPVPIELFSGRIEEIQRIVKVIGQVELGKPQAIFLTGEYGIGKSSLAGFMRYYAETKHNILGIHVFLGGAQTLEDVTTKIVETVIKSQAYKPTVTEKIRNFLSKYIGKQEFYGFSINFDALKADGLNISRGFLPFLGDLLERVKSEDIKGIMLIIDEINGITENVQFAHFVKSLVDENALSRTPLPLLLMFCGVDERRREMIRHHQSIERIFEIVEIKPMNESETRDFFKKAFSSVDIKIEDKAMANLCHYSTGFPKVMHIIGDFIFWIDQDNIVTQDDVINGILLATQSIGQKFVDHKVYNSLRSKDYRSILTKLGKKGFDLSFKKEIIEKELTEVEKKKFNNFLQRMKKLNVLKSGDESGEYIFTNRIIRLYIYLNSVKRGGKGFK